MICLVTLPFFLSSIINRTILAFGLGLALGAAVAAISCSSSSITSSSSLMSSSSSSFRSFLALSAAVRKEYSSRRLRRGKIDVGGTEEITDCSRVANPGSHDDSCADIVENSKTLAGSDRPGEGSKICKTEKVFALLHSNCVSTVC
jgi:hypothetical protein